MRTVKIASFICFLSVLFFSINVAASPFSYAPAVAKASPSVVNLYTVVKPRELKSHKNNHIIKLSHFTGPLC